MLAAHAVGIRPANNLAFAEPMFENEYLAWTRDAGSSRIVA